jgi:F0F1-type ATP synthase assembly protein I
MPRRKKSFVEKAAQYSSLAFLMPAASFAGYLVGYWLDGRFGTTWLRILFLILGTAGGFIEMIRQITRDSSDDNT